MKRRVARAWLALVALRTWLVTLLILMSLRHTGYDRLMVLWTAGVLLGGLLALPHGAVALLVGMVVGVIVGVGGGELVNRFSPRVRSLALAPAPRGSVRAGLAPAQAPGGCRNLNKPLRPIRIHARLDPNFSWVVLISSGHEQI